MKKYQISVVAMALVLPLAIYSCDEESDIVKETEASKFLANVNQDPIVVDEEKLGDSWRVAKYEYSYPDGEIVKEDTVNFLDTENAECPNYKEFLVIGKDQVMFVYEGECYGKSWDGYVELYDHRIDLENKTISIDYVNVGGDKNYTIDWKIIEISANKLVLRDNRPDSDYFYQYTFIREVFK